jgi:hypothetical protein
VAVDINLGAKKLVHGRIAMQRGRLEIGTNLALS